MEIFGPVQSRRFGMSLGINHLPPKVCSYACVYCQLGRTNFLTILPANFSQPDEIYRAVKNRLEELADPPDYLTFVSNGEPSLDTSLGKAIELLKCLDIPIAVISNASLLWKAETRSQLMQADAVSLKVDAVEKIAWRRINRPHGRLKLEQVLQGTKDFAQKYKGRLLTETMLVKGINTSPEQIEACAKFIAGLQPEMAYLALPLRSPAEDWVEAPSEQDITRAQRIFSEHFSRCALMADLPETGLSASDDPLQSLLNTIKVHPMEETEVRAYMRENHIAAERLEELVQGKQIQASDHRGKTFYSIRYEPTRRN
jgi:wyosine [tRNA(Phe)-imidazoG37] synthetase (radical SAM superfamily)